jgi:putative ABC transport system permease protein
VVPIRTIHFSARALGALAPRGDLNATYATVAVGALILLTASINFVNLMTARAARRATEVGVRKLAGASRSALVVQFIGESIVHVALAALLAMPLVELLLPSLNAFLGRTMAFDYAAGTLAITGLVVVVGALAGSYPALVLSAFRPAAVLKGGVIQGVGSAVVRQGLVTLQFAVLIGLIVATAVIWRQTAFAAKENLRLQSDQMLLINAPCASDTLREEIADLPGVVAAACSMSVPLAMTYPTNARLADGRLPTVYYNAVGFGFFELYGLRPLAGRSFSRAYSADTAPGAGDKARAEAVVINQSAVHDLGFASPAAAVGQTFVWAHIKTMDGVFTPPHPARIIGVVPDFPMGSIRTRIQPSAFYVDPGQLFLISVKLKGHDIPETLHQIDRLWGRLGSGRPISRGFFSQFVQGLYRDVAQQAQLFSVFAAVALLIACIGLFGLAAFAAERRTKEIGIRKVMGAGHLDILGLFLWQFTLPVLWSNLISWPLVFVVMTCWLHGFAYRIDLTVWPFVLAALAALLVAWLTVSAQALRASLNKPVGSLRYE